MPRFQPKNPDFRRDATAVFDAQPAMRTLGISIGRTLTVCEARAYAIDGLTEDLIASMTGTLMALMPKEERAVIETPKTAMV